MHSKKLEAAYFRGILIKILLSTHLLSKNIQIKFKYTYPKFYLLFCMVAKLKLPTKGGKQVEGLQGIFVRNVYGLRWRKWHEAGKNCTIGNSVTCTPRHLFIRRAHKDDMSGHCGTGGREEMQQGF